MNEFQGSFSELRQVLNEESTVLFIGSGISAWSGLPLWSELLEDLVGFIERKGYDPQIVRENIAVQPLMAASYGIQFLTNEEFAEFIKTECRSGIAKPHKIHRLITKLGPTCYLTTNYDHLLEDVLKRQKKRFKKIMNNQPLGCSSILPVGAKEYLFKLHGDMDIPESIVLSQEQYETQYSSGRRIYASRTLENILLTRTVVFIGFGLMDPDFKQIIAKIKNEYQLPSCTHYALVPDCSAPERDFWKKQYNIHLISYGAKTENGYNYSKILSFLEALLLPQASEPIKESKAKLTKRQYDSLNRYVNSLILRMDGENEVDLIFPLDIKIDSYSHYMELSTEELLFRKPEHSFVLTGNPGAGKSFFLKRYCRQLAISYHQQTKLSSKSRDYKIPVFVDLKSYSGRGSITTLIESQFTEDIPVNEWLDDGRFILFFDAYNEVPEQYRESKVAFNEIRRLDSRNIVIVGDRTGDAFSSGFHKYCLSHINIEYVDEYLKERGISLSEIKKETVLFLLKKPLFFQLLYQNKIQVNNTTTARTLYDGYFVYLDQAFQKEFDAALNLKEVLLPFAYNLIVSGSEGFAVENLTGHLIEHLTKGFSVEPIKIVNWLFDTQQFLSPLRGEILSFFHQSITEFLAGNHLARQYMINRDILLEHLQYTRLDYVVLYATEFLPDNQAPAYIRNLLEADMLLAMRACAYLEQDAENTVQLVLEYINDRIFNRGFDYQINFAEIDLPVSVSHETVLRKLMQDKNIVGGKAAAWLIRVMGSSAIDEMLEELFDNFGCYNYLSEISNALAPYLSISQFFSVMDRVSRIPNLSDTDLDSTVSPLASLSQNLDIQDILRYASERGGFISLTQAQKEIINWILVNDASQEAFDWALLQFKAGSFEFAYCIYLKICYHVEEYDLSFVDSHFLYALFMLINDETVDNSTKRYGIELMQSTYQCCPTFAKLVRSNLKGSTGIIRLAILYAIGKNRTKTFFGDFSSMLYFKELPGEIIGAFGEFKWSEDNDYTDYIIEILVDKYPLDSLSMFLESTLKSSRLYCPSLETFLKLMVYIQETFTRSDMFSDMDKVGGFLARHVQQQSLFDFYRTTNSKMNQLFNYCVLNRIEGLEIDDFTKKEINVLIRDLSKIDYNCLYPNSYLLSKIATDSFVTERLLPLMKSCAEGSLLYNNLKIIIECAEQQLGQRYLMK